MAPSTVRPRLEKSATWSSRSTAPTVSAAAIEPGDSIEGANEPLLPAETTNREVTPRQTPPSVITGRGAPLCAV
ncbi:MAG TPA: hypothetical protein VNN80_15755 [Polyangiaceae bacterium]|nr:hypothetical protein [Polyangiaceae bacterium]